MIEYTLQYNTIFVFIVYQSFLGNESSFLHFLKCTVFGA